MADRQTITRFESLPNELLIDCLSYFNATDMFCAFDSLNSRLDHLIRHVPLYLYIDDVTNAKRLQCCTNVLSNPQTKKQIISLNLSTKNFFSFVSLNEFPQLRALTLSHLNRVEATRISSFFPLLPKLRYLAFKLCDSHINEVQLVFSSPTVRRLSIGRFREDFILTHPFTSLLHLTIFYSSVEDLCYLLRHVPRLQYLKIEHIWRSGYLTHYHEAVHLKQLIVGNFSVGFPALVALLTRTPNLKVLMISGNQNTEVIDALLWENTITNRLPRLDVFKFIFGARINYGDRSIVSKFTQFQTEFWHQQHHWNIEYLVENFQVLIYTVPYMSNAYQITPNTKRSVIKSIDDTSRFVNVTKLTLCLQVLTNNGGYHFENVRTLRIQRLTVFGDEYPLLEIKHIERLKAMIRLRNLIHLDISLESGWKSPSVLLELLKQTPNLSSLKIANNTLFAMFRSRELCNYFSKMIKKLEITSSAQSLVVYHFEISEICDVFFNLEEFRYYNDRTANFKEIFNQLSKLTHLRVFCCIIPDSNTRNHSLDNHEAEFDLYPFIIKYEVQ